MSKSGVPANAEEGYRRIAPKIEFQAWENVGHFIMMEKPAEFNEALGGFLIKNGLLKK